MRVGREKLVPITMWREKINSGNPHPQTPEAHRTYSSGSDALAAVDSIVPQPETKGNTDGAVGAVAAGVKAQGKESRVSTQAGDSVDTRFKVVEADDLIASHNEAFGENENYPQELQPRKRGRAASQHQVEHIISNLNPELLGDSKLASDGAPIVGSDNIVESGNGRVLALKLAYGRGQATEKQAQKYRQYLSDNAEQFGLSTEQVSSMKKPVLVRERTSDVDRKSFAQNANVSSVATMSSSETALKDADKLDIGMLESLNTDLDVLNSKDFISTFARDVVPKNELGTFIDDRGNLSQDGMRRVKNALFVKAYGDEQTLARMSESTDDNTRNISRALLQASTAVAPVQAKIKDGLLRKDLSMAEHIIQAANTLSSLRDKGMKVSEFLQQGNIFDEGGISPEARQILQFFDKNKQKPNVITNYLKDTARRVAAEGDGNQGSLFGGKQKSLNDILRSAESEATPKQKGLWDDIKKREAARKYVIDDATKQLKATGMEQSEIDSNVALMTAVFETFAEREGIGADELYKMYDIEFRKGDKAKGEDPNKVVMEVRNQEASHGSAVDFDEFDFSFMGTGEGAQAFGYGGYFGQDRKMLDEQYRQRLLRNIPSKTGVLYKGKSAMEHSNADEISREALEKICVFTEDLGFDKDKIFRRLTVWENMHKKNLDTAKEEQNEKGAEAAERQVKIYSRAKEILMTDELTHGTTKAEGQLYDVEIPDDHELLLWDKPMGEQPDVVKKAAKEFFRERVELSKTNSAKTLGKNLSYIREKFGDAYADKISSFMKRWKELLNYEALSADSDGSISAEYIKEKRELFLSSDNISTHDRMLISDCLFDIFEIKGSADEGRLLEKQKSRMVGETLYRYMADELGSDKAASLWLLDHGVKGHKFLDGNSRSKGEGTYNFVIWDEKAIQIKKKYYQGGQEQKVWSVEENMARGMAAMDKVIAEQTDVLDAMYRDDVGDVSFFWGELGRGEKFRHGWGISHLIARRNSMGFNGEEIARKMVEVLVRGNITKRYNVGKEGQERVDITHDGHCAHLALYKNGNRQTWVITGYELTKEKSPGAPGERSGSAGATLSEPIPSRLEEGAGEIDPI